MVLVSVQPEDNGLTSWWRPTHHMNWENVCRAAHSACSEVFTDAVIYVNEEPIKTPNSGELLTFTASNADEILKITEHSTITLHGRRNVPMIMTFCNHLQLVEVKLPYLNNRIMESDYQKLNMLLGPYMDRIESAMH